MMKMMMKMMKMMKMMSLLAAADLSIPRFLFSDIKLLLVNRSVESSHHNISDQLKTKFKSNQLMK